MDGERAAYPVAIQKRAQIASMRLRKCVCRRSDESKVSAP
jgi:hypothetical protein